MTDVPVLRRLGPDDGPVLAALNALFAEVFEDPASYAAHPPDAAWVRTVLGREGVIALVAESGPRVVGGLVAYELDKLEQTRREVYLYDLAVAADRRREGIATALIARLCELARARGAWTVFVQADPGDDPAIALYTRLGTREDVLHFDIAPPRPVASAPHPDEETR